MTPDSPLAPASCGAIDLEAEAVRRPILHLSSGFAGPAGTACNRFRAKRIRSDPRAVDGTAASAPRMIHPA